MQKQATLEVRARAPIMNYIQNRDELLSHGQAALRCVALDIAENAIAAADPGPVARRILIFDGNSLKVGDRTFDLANNTRVFVIGAGKASYPIAKAIDEIIGSRIHRGLITCKEGQAGELAHIELHWASHPIPGPASLDAAERTKMLLREVRPGDIVLSCFTGGSSALFVDPVVGITLEEKAETNRVLLGCGANILEINAVRKHLSRVKGGNLVRGLPSGAHLINLTVSDVIGDPLDYITDPSVPDTSTYSDASKVLDKYDLWSCMPVSVAKFLRSASNQDETTRETDLDHFDRTDILLVKSDAACHAAAAAARDRGFNALFLSSYFESESRELGRFIAAIAKQVMHDGHPVKSPCVLIAGGESTVLGANSGGCGGPNQEFAVSFALELAEQSGVVALGLDTDGTDGPTPFAGGLVDGTTASRARQLNVDLYQSLMRHDVSPALQQLGDTVLTGATGTNVNDLKLVVIAAMPQLR
jgi:glycerate 2-kinase